MTDVPVDPVVLVLSAADDFDDLAGAATLPDLGPLDDDPVAHACVHGLILRRRLARADRVPSAGPDFMLRGYGADQRQSPRTNRCQPSHSQPPSTTQRPTRDLVTKATASPSVGVRHHARLTTS